MNIHEYQAKELLAKTGIAVPAGFAAMTVEEAVAAAKPAGTAIPVLASRSLAWYSWMFMHGSRMADGLRIPARNGRERA